MTPLIHQFVPGQTTCTLLLLHGTGGNEDSMLQIGKFLDENANMLSPRGNVLEGSMPRFFKRLSEGVFDLEDLKIRSQELAGFVLDSAKEYGFDASNVIAVGYSNGANIATSVLLRQPNILRGAILLHGQLPFASEQLPDLTTKNIFASAGLQDPLISQAQFKELVDVLENANANVTTHVHAGGHEVSHQEIAAAKIWLDKQH